MIKAKAGSSNALRGVHVAFWFVVAMMAYGVYKAYSAGQTMSAMRQEQTARQIAEEDRAFCEKLGMRVDGGDYAKCCQDLAIIRRRQADRDRRDAEGLF